MILYFSGVSSPIQPHSFKGEIPQDNVMLSFARIEQGDRDQIAMLAKIELERREAAVRRRRERH